MGRRILLVEGIDDKHVVKNLLRERGITGIEIVDMSKPGEGNGFEALLQSLPVQWKTSDLESLAVIVDADEDLDRRWQQMKFAAENRCGCRLPKHPTPGGTVVDAGDGRKLAIWIMPDNTLPGMLENFVATLIPDGDALLPYVDTFLQGIPTDLRLFSDSHLPKARIHSWLAVQEEPGRPMGLSITMRVLDARCKSADLFVEWIRAALLS